MKKEYTTPQSKFILLEGNEMLAQSEILGKGGSASQQDAPRTMESNHRSGSIWGE